MDILEDQYLIVAKKLSSFFGIWYTQTLKERLFFNCIIGCFFLCAVLIQLCQLLTMDFNLRSIVSVLQMFIPVVCTTSIYSVSILQFPTLQEILSWVVQDCQQLKDELELKIMQKSVNECKLFTTICGCLFYLFVTFSIFPFVLQIITYAKEVISIEHQDPVFSCINHLLQNDFYYNPIVISEIITAFIIPTVALIIYSFYFWFIQHACARLCIIKCKINKLFEHNQHEDNVLEEPLDLSNWTIDIIQRLSRTREFMDLVNKFSEKCYLFNMSLGLLLVVLDFLCIPILIRHTETRNDSITFLVFIIDTLFPLYLNCFVGQRLIDYSSDVYEEMCLIPIHEMSMKTQKLLLTTLMMNAKPCTISIGKMFVSSHEFFGDLLRMSISFAMMLHSTGDM